MNADRSGFNNEILSNIRGSKTVDAVVIGKNKITLPYTIQMTIIAEGKFIDPLFLIFQQI